MRANLPCRRTIRDELLRIRCWNYVYSVLSLMDAPIGFEWDDAKAEMNAVKHGVRFEVAIAVFLDERHVVMDTSRPQDGEERRKVVGTIQGRAFTVVFVMRGGACRVISARRANTSEERAYGNR